MNDFLLTKMGPSCVVFAMAMDFAEMRLFNTVKTDGQVSCREMLMLIHKDCTLDY